MNWQNLFETEVIETMKTGIVWHRNWIEDEINISLEKHPDTPNGYIGRSVFCKKFHKITEPLAEDCNDCPYFAGLMQGWGHECAWEDVMDDKYIDGDTLDIPWESRHSELRRVSRLIDKGIIRKG